MVRLDMRRKQRNGTESDSIVESENLQVDYAGLKRLQMELQSALEELESVHCNRLMHYIG